MLNRNIQFAHQHQQQFQAQMRENQIRHNESAHYDDVYRTGPKYSYMNLVMLNPNTEPLKDPVVLELWNKHFSENEDYVPYEKMSHDEQEDLVSRINQALKR